MAIKTNVNVHLGYIIKHETDGKACRLNNRTKTFIITTMKNEKLVHRYMYVHIIMYVSVQKLLEQLEVVRRGIR